MKEPAAAFLDPKIAASLRITTIEKNALVYLEVYRRLRRLIKCGVLKPGDSLPSEHALASIMCVGRTSLRTALSLLYEDGYIKIKRGKGSYVTGDSRSEKYKRKFPSHIVLPTERIELLGELSCAQAFYSKATEDEFLNEKLSPNSDVDIKLFEQLYYLNGEPAIISTFYFCSDLFFTDPTDTLDDVSRKLFDVLHRQAIVAECECVPVRMVNQSNPYQMFSGDNHLLVTTQYIGENGILAFSKDYYNSEVIRFRFAQNKQL